MNRYEYERLLAEDKSLRLLTLRPENFSDELHVEVKLSALSGDIPIYEALSYVWSSPEDPTPVVIGLGPQSSVC